MTDKQKPSLYLGDCLEVMRKMPDNSVDCVVTDPPYGLEFMEKEWDKGVPSVVFWREMLRVMKPGAYLLSFGGSRTYHRMASAIEDAGFEIRDQIMWVYGSGFPKSHNIRKAVDISKWEGWGTALKPAHEPIVMARKPLGERTVAANVLKWGTGGINIDGCRVEFAGEADEAESKGKNQHSRYKNSVMRNPAPHGIYNKDKRKPTDYKSKGRFPANFIHDGSEEVVREFPDTKSRGHAPKLSKANPFGGVNDSPRREAHFDIGSAARFFYCAKASKRERGEENKHPTVKPIKLMRYLCRLVTPKGGTVLDPFLGSGTTAIAAYLEGLDFIGIELDEEYFNIAQKRINQYWGQERLR